ncbi:MAG: tRNA lysidine(34) synthetase TilS [Rhodocyclaceae bacterium]|nr:tRNA lysidine(34) synthetase TilS [Rhodocyclaceae bacterium]
MDSVVLLHVLAAQWRAMPNAFSLSALHVHHGISPHADRWAAFCADYARRLGVPCTCAHVEVERGSKDGLEAAARRARHAVFADTDADWIMLAHQRDDQAETLLFNLLRGTGIAGAAAMRECSGRLLRPLLTTDRSEIERYANAHRLEWCDDESNADVRHSRNFLRHRILAPLSQRFPAAAKNLAAAAARFAEAQDLLDALARLDLGEDSGGFPLSLNKLRSLDEPRARNILRYLLAQRAVPIPSEARLREALRQMLDARPDRHPALVLGAYRLLRRRDRIYLEPVDASIDRR